MNRRDLILAGLGAGTLPAFAQDRSTRPIRLVVPFNPGGALDAFARRLAPALGARLGQPVVVDNRPGGNTIVATQYVARAPADGLTLYVTLGSPYSMLPSLYRRPLPYDANTDFTPLGTAVEIKYGLTVGTSQKIGSAREFVEFAKKNPGKLSYGSTGTGQALTLSMELLKSRLGIDTLHVPFTGQSQVAQALISGQVDSALMDVGIVEQHVKTGRMKMLAIVSNTRSAQLPNVPTLHEEGIQLDIPPLWIGLVGPRGLPASVVATLNDALVREVRTPAMVEWLEQAGLSPMPGSPQEMAGRIQSERIIWSGLIKQLGVTLD